VATKRCAARTRDLSFEASDAFCNKLDELAAKTGDSTGEVLVKSLALLSLAIQARDQGKRLVITGNGDNSPSVEVTDF
jgi:hypothetical protein